MTKGKVVILLIVICILMAVIPLNLSMNAGSEFGGADGAASDVVAEFSPDFEPWAEPLIELPGGETESLLFCLQASIGASIIGYAFGVYRERTRKEENEGKN